MQPRKQPRRNPVHGSDQGGKGKKKIRRGPALCVEPPNREEDRPEVVIEGARFRREPYKKDKDLALVIGQILKNYYPGAGSTSYREWDDDTKRNCFNEFLRRYKLHDSVREDVARIRFNSMATRKLTKTLYVVRKTTMERTKSDNPLDWVGYEPSWIQVPDWKLLIQEWLKEYFKALSERNGQNRLASDDVAFATTGALSMVDHKYLMMEENGMQEPTGTELFVRTHTKKSTGVLVSNKAKKMKDDMLEAMIQKYGDDLSKHPSSDIELWCKVTGGVLHGNMYGMGGSIDCRVQGAPRLIQSNFPTQTHSSVKYIDEEKAKTMLEAQITEMEGRAKLREAEREKRLKKNIKRALRENQRTFMLAILTMRNEGVSTLRQPQSEESDGSSGSGSNSSAGD